MPKFLYTILVLSITLWWLVLKTLISRSPNTSQIIIGVLILLFLSVALTLSMPIYLYFYKKAPGFTNLRFLYRKSFKWASVVGFSVIGILGLRAFNLDSIVNILLFSVLCVLLVLQLKKTR